ncbi:holocytochrome c synthase [Microbotryomycetes sp. JL201]|nr:holocytochrome c synthase [Microbotryomycetes sp. JL201]
MGQAQSSAAPTHSDIKTSQQQQPPAECPMHKSAPVPSSCPVDHRTQAPQQHAPWGSVNPENNMPSLAQAPSAGQTMALPLERTISSIPRAAPTGSESTPPSACPVAHGQSNKVDPSDATAAGKWEYPSPQQFYNALVRKGWETPEESIEMMVNIHNWLNEEAWQQVRTWEEKHEGQVDLSEGDRSMLASFSGRPKDLSPKARYHLFMGKLFPNSYASVRPFDRHDWVVHRPVVADRSTQSYTAPSSTQKFTSHRYVIDYYSLPDDASGNPVFSLDVRPAIDDVASLRERLSYWYEHKRSAWLGNDGTVPGVRAQEGH